MRNANICGIRSSFSSVNLIGGEGGVNGSFGARLSNQKFDHGQPETELPLHLHLPNEALPLAITVAIVRWPRRETFGVEFMDMNETEWKRLGRFIQGLE